MKPGRQRNGVLMTEALTAFHKVVNLGWLVLHIQEQARDDAAQGIELGEALDIGDAGVHVPYALRSERILACFVCHSPAPMRAI